MGEGSAADAERSENSHHVVTGSGEGSSAILDGFTVYGGNANGSQPHNTGGGMLNESNGDATVRHCTFFQSFADFGGGMYNADGSGPTLENCVFQQNLSQHVGGGMDNTNSAPSFTDCQFIRNEAQQGGGGLNFKNVPANITLTRCNFVENVANITSGDGGGGAYFGSGSYTVTFNRCDFRLNTAKDGAGAYVDGPSATFTGA